MTDLSWDARTRSVTRNGGATPSATPTARRRTKRSRPPRRTALKAARPGGFCFDVDNGRRPA